VAVARPGRPVGKCLPARRADVHQQTRAGLLSLALANRSHYLRYSGTSPVAHHATRVGADHGYCQRLTDVGRSERRAPCDGQGSTRYEAGLTVTRARGEGAALNHRASDRRRTTPTGVACAQDSGRPARWPTGCLVKPVPQTLVAIGDWAGNHDIDSHSPIVQQAAHGWQAFEAHLKTCEMHEPSADRGTAHEGKSGLEASCEGRRGPCGLTPCCPRVCGLGTDARQGTRTRRTWTPFRERCVEAYARDSCPIHPPVAC
jgi:hypothetical protein